MVSIRSLLAALCATGVGLTPGAVLAQERQSTFDMPVAAAVVNMCTVAAPPLTFNAPPGTTGTLRSTTTVQVACTTKVPFVVSMDYGDNPLGVNRRMKNTTRNAFVRYEIYSNPTYTKVWSDKPNQRVSGTTGTTGTALLTAYGEVKNLGAIPAGIYVDTVTVTVNY